MNLIRQAGEKQRELRRRISEALYALLVRSRFEAMDYRRNLWLALNQGAQRLGLGRKILEDMERRPLSYQDLIRQARMFGRRFMTFSRPGENVGLMLPNTNIAVISLFALWAGGRVVVLLNYIQGVVFLNSALVTARVQIIITSCRFLEKAKLIGLVEALSVRLVYLEDFKIGFRDWLVVFTWRGRPPWPQIQRL
ncbi:MAG: hypothetical protein AMR96_06420 [Candidatus Adiutrix intracellularis]|nr:MAG: hypothetical protein AMR96_06420 [Candidatus Adiutrix intracellularis]